MPASDVVKFQTNIPEVIALEFAVGKPVTSQFGGDQVMFSLTDGRRMYLPPFVADKIHNAGIAPRKQFAICKREVTHGNRRSVEYQIETPNEETATASVNAPAVRVGATSEPAATTTKQPATHGTNGGGNALVVGRVALAGAPPPSAPSPDAAQPIGETAAMIEAHKRAIDVAAAAEDYAKSRGLAIHYAAEDIRAIAATIFIQQSRGGAR